MKAHYINILLFALPLNILEHNQRNHNNTTLHTPITRSLCECELYTSIYDNDPQMKSVMQQFEDRTSQRFHEYDDRMKTTRQKCKDKCDKYIQKIILKDKLEKELTEKLSTLQTDIRSDAIPTCVCEKSMSDKVEKGCLKCGGVLGGGVAPSVAILGGIGICGWKMGAPAAAIKAAIKAGALAGKAAGEAKGVEVVIDALRYYGVEIFWPEMSKSIGTKIPFTDIGQIANTIITKREVICGPSAGVEHTCLPFDSKLAITEEGVFPVQYADPSADIPKFIKTFVEGAKEAADIKAGEVTTSETEVFKETYMAAVESTTTSCQIAIITSIVAIVVIVLVMVIIYKILRYRRKKKMKKKLQYIKLLEE
ncbi:rifin [Plasmodium reichenowi]|uniref:Rifin n=1 Tax=Plasmodium reichenowi TaxID=5854 RepID=A0A060RMA0_PLARE|nr:rifin [Plasmodium reichenowi]